MFRYLSYTKLLIQIRMLFPSVSVLHSEPCQHVVFLFYLLTYLFIYLSVFELGVWSEAVVMTCLLSFPLRHLGMDWRLQSLPTLELWCWCLLRLHSSHLALHPLPPACHLTGFISSCGIVLHFRLAVEGSSSAKLRLPWLHKSRSGTGTALLPSCSTVQSNLQV